MRQFEIQLYNVLSEYRRPCYLRSNQIKFIVAYTIVHSAELTAQTPRQVVTTAQRCSRNPSRRHRFVSMVEENQWTHSGNRLCDESTPPSAVTLLPLAVWALVWNEPLCAPTLFLWEVKSEAVEVAVCLSPRLWWDVHLATLHRRGARRGRDAPRGNEGRTRYSWTDDFSTHICSVIQYGTKCVITTVNAG